MGAGGRDFHDFNVAYRDDAHTTVVVLTAAQIPGIADRTYPASLAGPRYPNGIPIVGEERLSDVVRDHDVDEVVFAYSDLSHLEVMHRASIAMAAGADFRLLGPDATMLRSTQAGRGRVRDADRRGQEPDEPARRPPADRSGPPGRARAAHHALRRPGGHADAALRHPGRHRRGEPDHRGARGVRGARAPGHGDVRRRRLRGGPAPGGGRGRRRRPGRRQQRLPVLRAGPADHGH